MKLEGKYMRKCDLCNSTLDDNIVICSTCGYSLEKKEVVNRDTVHTYLSKLRKDNKWLEEIKLKRRLNDIQRQKYPEWSERKTAELLEERNSVTSPDIRLAEGLDRFTILSESKTKFEAHRRFKEIKDGSTISGDKHTFKSEEDFQKYLYDHWEETPLNEEWELQRKNKIRKGKCQTGEIGEIDLLAKHRKEENRWLVIEIKLAKSSDETVGQILRYMGWVKENNIAGENGKVQGLIISETADVHIRYAMKCVTNIDLKIYRFNKDKLEFKQADDVFVRLTKKQNIDELRKVLSDPEFMKIFDNLNHKT
jgi:hypothetical protein